MSIRVHWRWDHMQRCVKYLFHDSRFVKKLSVRQNIMWITCIYQLCIITISCKSCYVVNTKSPLVLECTVIST